MPRHLVARTASLLGVVVLAGCAMLSPDRSATRTDIEHANRAFEAAVGAGDVERIGSLYTPDAIAFPPDSPMVRGRDAIKQLWGAVIRDMGLKAVTLRTVDVDRSGDTAYETGEASLRLEPRGGQASTAAIKYVVVWKRADGQWRIHRDIWNAMPAR
ncbi:MAG: YybH family protein [Candidatus Rokuibacteriota bacterium]